MWSYPYFVCKVTAFLLKYVFRSPADCDFMLYIKSYSAEFCIFAEDKLHLGIDHKQACISALGLHYFCNKYLTPIQSLILFKHNETRNYKRHSPRALHLGVDGVARAHRRQEHTPRDPRGCAARGRAPRLPPQPRSHEPEDGSHEHHRRHSARDAHALRLAGGGGHTERALQEQPEGDDSRVGRGPEPRARESADDGGVHGRRTHREHVQPQAQP